MIFYTTPLLFLVFFSFSQAQANTLLQEQSSLSRDDAASTVEDERPVSRVISNSPLLSFHRSLCQIESTTDNENAVGEFLFSYLKKHNFNVLRQEVPPHPSSSGSKNKSRRFNVFAWPKAHVSSSVAESEESDKDAEDDLLGNFAPKIIVTSHIDTVPPFIPYSVSAPGPSSQDGIVQELNRSNILISGRGTVDAKACVAAQLHALLSLISSPNHASPPGSQALPVALLFVVGEEYYGDGMKTFSSSSLHQNMSKAYTTVIFGEPTESQLPSGHKGLVLFSLHATGKAAHSGYPWLGSSANSILIPVLSAVDQLGDAAEADGGLPRSQKYGNSTVNIGLVRGGVAANVVAAKASAEVAVRLAGGTPEQAKAIISEAVKKASGEVAVDVVFSGPAYPPVDLDSDIDDFPGNLTVNYGTDVPNLQVQSGVKRYLYGPGSILVAHGDHEALTVGELEASVDGYRKLILAALARQI